jgi:hypothetical protein
MAVARIAEITHHWQIAWITNSSRYVSHAEKMNPLVAHHQQHCEAASESAKRSLQRHERGRQVRMV